MVNVRLFFGYVRNGSYQAGANILPWEHTRHTTHSRTTYTDAASAPACRFAAFLRRLKSKRSVAIGGRMRALVLCGEEESGRIARMLGGAMSVDSATTPKEALALTRRRVEPLHRVDLRCEACAKRHCGAFDSQRQCDQHRPRHDGRGAHLARICLRGGQAFEPVRFSIHETDAN